MQDYKCGIVNVVKFRTLLFLYLNKMLVFRAGIHKMHAEYSKQGRP